ncbi:MAG: hypothetical protein DHS20C06_00780 [Hyphobacterium sp.]|nr:MAG: hypothetical protein DHS20C06_00780 [Hyphobacterium sp.]
MTSLSWAAFSLLLISSDPVGKQAMDTLTLDQQQQTMAFSIRAAGHDCEQATELVYSGELNASALYSVRCGSGMGYLVRIMPDADMTSRVLTCQELITMGVNFRCFETYGASSPD